MHLRQVNTDKFYEIKLPKKQRKNRDFYQPNI